MSKLQWRGTLAVVGVMLSGLWLAGGQLSSPPVAEAQGPPPAAQAAERAREELFRVMAIQEKHTERLMENPGVVGTATGLDGRGRPVVRILVEDRQTARQMPRQLNDVSVQVDVTGPILALRDIRPNHHRDDHRGGPGGGNGGNDDENGEEEEDPVHDEGLLGSEDKMPIGVSTGNAEECSAGTVGCRLFDGEYVYALSNNHVYARENAAELGELIVIPGVFDTFDDEENGCYFNPDNVIGILWDYEPIRFGGGPRNVNYIDAAIAWTTELHLDNSTPDGFFDEDGNQILPDGYGIPSSDYVGPEELDGLLGKDVLKYGRTTRETDGEVTGINATVRVRFRSGQATFADQIFVEGDEVSQPGDSGSLFVTDDEDEVHRPVGLLFAGNSDGSLTVANQIWRVLDRFDMDVDDIDDAQ